VAQQTINIPLPPQEFITAVGGGDFHAVGQHFFEIFVHQGGLLPEHSVLDIGSGCGRMAIPLLSYLDQQSEYHGIDIVEPMVTWCTENISSRFPNFQFHHVKLKNTLYSEAGEVAAKYKFPFPDQSFDFVFLTSVFTHLNPEDTENYLQEIQRVLKIKGRVVMTFYFMTEEYPLIRKNDRARVTFDHGAYPYWVNDPEVPEAISAYDESFAFGKIRSAGLSINAVYYGNWNGHSGLSWQDVVVAFRPDPLPMVVKPIAVPVEKVTGLRKLRSWLFPANSLQERIARFVLNAFKKFFK
jgi:SAM-dependent methyltransferase